MLFKAYLPSVLTLLVFFRSAWSSPIQSLEDLESVNNLEDLEKRQSGFHLVTGVSGAAAPRLEIRTLQSSRPDQWNLYLLAMQRFQNVAQTDPLSYYQIAGIHGRPYKSWDNVAITRGAGYCTHVSNLFLTWHRPYLALFEQAVYSHMQAVVNSFPASSRQRWANAAANFRIPYWDWAIAPNGQTVPGSMTAQTVTVTTPSGQQSIRNPLFSYYFHPLSQADMAFSPFTLWGNTKRHPTSNTASAVSDNNAFAAAANNQRVGLRDRIYNMFTNSALTFTSVSNEAVGGGSGNPSSHDSFESVHDSIHVLTGGTSGGHMYYIDFSAFDPAFWLHHTNVDRLFNLYQALYPNKYVQSGAQQQNNAWASRGDIKDANSALIPFHRTQTTYWTSATIRRARDFNYYYPETSDGFTAASVRAAINRLYGSGAGVSKRDNIPYDGQTPSVNSTYGPENFNSTVPINGTSYDREYSINIQCPKYAIDGSFAIYFFLGEFDEDPLTYPSASSLVGVNGVLSPITAPDVDVTVGCKLPLSTYIKQRWAEGKLKSLDYDVVNQYLTENLHWRIVKVDGTLVDASTVGGLLISVESSKVKPAGSYDEFPQYVPNTTNIHGPITHGKPGGYTGNMPPPGSYSMPAGPAYSSYAPGGYAAPSGYASYTGGVSYYSAASYAKPTPTACKA